MEWAKFAIVIVLTIAIVIGVLGWWIKPHIEALYLSREQWKARALAAENELAEVGEHGVKVLDAQESLEGDLDVWLRDRKGGDR